VAKLQKPRKTSKNGGGAKTSKSYQNFKIALISLAKTSKSCQNFKNLQKLQNPTKTSTSGLGALGPGRRATAMAIKLTQNGALR